MRPFAIDTDSHYAGPSMLFKNLRLYRLTKPFNADAEQLERDLQSTRFHPCGSLEPFSYGWAPPLGRHGSALVHAANGCLLVCARREEKILPATVVRQTVEDRVAVIEQEQARKVRRKERNRMRDEVLHDLLPRALVRSTYTFAYVSPRDGWLVVDSASPKKADELISLLRQSLGTLALQPPAVQHAPATVMTAWLSGDGLPADIAVADECELRDTAEQAAVIRCKHQDLGADEVQALITAGRQAVKLSVVWDGRLSGVLGEDLSVRRLRFEDVVQEEFGPVETPDEAARFDAEFTMMTLELSRFLDRLVSLFGGESEEVYARSA